jgi:pimeloyl-ACP methyl ester carboxylesterase
MRHPQSRAIKILQFLSAILLVLIIAAGSFLYKSSIPAGIIDARYESRFSQYFLMENGSRIHYRDEGNRRGEPIVLIHGSNASLHTWEPWVAILGEEFRMITLDLPGHGLTGAVPDEDYSTNAFVKTIDATITQLGLEQFTLGGNSMGGGVTWRYTLKYPEKVNAMLLIGASGLPQWQLDSTRDQSKDEKATPLIFELLTKPWFRAISTKLDPYYFTKQGVLAAYNNSPVVTDELIMRYYKLSLREGSREAIMKRLDNLDVESDTTYDLSTITQPTLILWGEEDALISLAVAEKFDSVLPVAALVTFPDTGHMLMEEIPGKSAKAVKEFMLALKTEPESTEEENSQ